MLSRRDKERKSSLDALAKFAYGSAPPPPPPVVREPPRAPLPPAARPPPRPTPKPPEPAYRMETEQDRVRRAQAEARRAKLEEERMLKARREQELARSKNLQWRGMDIGGIPSSIRRTGFDRAEPNVQQKIADVLGDAREKESRAKNRDKGRRQGGR